MKLPVEIYNELKEAAPFLAEMEKNNVFFVPENYFSELEIQILKKISPDPFHILPASEPPFSVPDGYFENLSKNILQKIKTFDYDNAHEELEQISPTLYSAEKKNVFTVPEGYFDTLSSSLLNILKPQARVVIMKKRSMVWNCAAAAIITAVMAISALWTSNYSLHDGFATADTKNGLLNIKDALQYKNEQQIDEGIADLSDADIIKYLQNTGNIADDEALASDIPDKELPDEQDYLTDENTLQIFLGEKADPKNNQN